MDDAIQNFMALSGVEDVNVARFYVECSAGDVNTALNNYLDESNSKTRKRKAQVYELNDDEDEDSIEIRPSKKAVRFHTRKDKSHKDKKKNQEIESLSDGERGPPDSMLAEDVDEYVRAPLKPKQMRLVEPTRPKQQQNRSVRLVNDSVFENIAAFHPDSEEFVVQGGANDTSKKLAQLFRPPVEIMFRGSLEEASAEAEKQSRYLLVNIQLGSTFESMQLNRDTWNNPSVQNLIRREFVFWQQEASAQLSRPYRTYYSIEEYPHIALLDPRTGERLDFWGGFVGPVVLVKQLKEFLDKNPFDSSERPRPVKPPIDLTGSKPVETVPSEEGDLDDLSEDAQMEAAIRMSMMETHEEPASGEPKTEPEKPNLMPSQSLSDAKEDEKPPVALTIRSSSQLGSQSSQLSQAEAASKGAALVAALDPVVAKKQCTIQFRLPSGEQFQATFPASTLLNDLFAHVRSTREELKSSAFDLLTTFPKRRYTENDINTLAGAELLPRAVLIVEETQ